MPCRKAVDVLNPVGTDPSRTRASHCDPIPGLLSRSTCQKNDLERAERVGGPQASDSRHGVDPGSGPRRHPGSIDEWCWIRELYESHNRLPSRGGLVDEEGPPVHRAADHGDLRGDLLHRTSRQRVHVCRDRA